MINPERALLGGILDGWRGNLDDLPVTGADFYHPQHEAVWQALERDRDPYAVQTALQGARVAPGLVADLITEGCLPAQIEYYAGIVAEASGKRSLVDAGRRIIQLGESDKALDDLTEDARTALDKIGSRSRGQVVDMAQAVQDATEAIEHPERGIPWPWDINDRMMPIAAGRVYVIAARPGQGKSIAGQNLAVDAARRGLPVSYASMEMSRDELTIRMAAQVGTLELTRLMKGTMTERDWEVYARAAAHVAELPIHIDEDSTQTLAHIRQYARDVARRRGSVGMVVVDYLQLMESTTKADRHIQVGEFSRGLHRMAKDMKVPVVALAQLNRAADGKPPTMGNLRESGSIEQDADVVVLLHRDDEEFPGQLDWIVAKQRNGPAGFTCHLGMAGHHARIEDM